jgi:hypothetical protein
MARRASPLFLARASYRRRRLRDAARLLPILGAFLLLLPLLWTPEGKISMTSGDMVFFFTVWLLLILAAAAFGRGLRGGGDRPDEDED